MYRSKDQRKQENSECMKIITDDTLRLNMAGKCDKQHRKIADGIRTKTEKVGSVTMIKYSECKKTESNRVKTNRDKRDLDKLKLSVKNSRKRSYGIIPLADMCTKTILMKASSEPYTEIRVNIQIDKTILLKDNYCQDANTFNVRDSISSIDDYLLNRKTDSNVLSQKTKWTDQSKSSVRDILTTKSLTVDHTGKDLNKSERSTKLDSHSISNHKKSLELRDTEFFSKKSHKVYNYPGNSNVKSQESNSNCGRNLLKSQESNINCGKNLLKSLESNINCGRNLPKSQESNINCGRNLLKSQEIFTESDRNIFAVLGAKALADKLTENNRFKTEPTDTSYDNSTPLTTCSPSSASKSEKWTEIIKVKTESIDNSYGNLNSFTRPYINKSHLELRVETTQVHCSVGSSSPLRQTAEKNENDITSDYEGSSTGLPSEDEDIKEEALEPVRCSSLQTDTQPEFDEDLPMLISPQRKKMKLEDKTTVAQMKPPKDSSTKDSKIISNSLKITEKKKADITRRNDSNDRIRTKECTSLSKKAVHEKCRRDDKLKSYKTFSFDSSKTNLGGKSEGTKLTLKDYSSEKIKHSEKNNPTKTRHNSSNNDARNLPSKQKNSSTKSRVTLEDVVGKDNIKTQSNPFEPDTDVHLESKHNVESKEIECKMKAVAVDIFKLANEFQKVKKSYSETTKTDPETITLAAIVRDECSDKTLSKSEVDKAVRKKNQSIISDVQNKMKISTLIDECKRNTPTHGHKTKEIDRSKCTDKTSIQLKNEKVSGRKEGERKVSSNNKVIKSRDNNGDNRVLKERSRKHDVKYDGRRCDEKYESLRYDEGKMRRCDGNRRYDKRDRLRADDATKLVGRYGSGIFDKDDIYKPYESGTPIRLSTERDEKKILGNAEMQSGQEQNERTENPSTLIRMNNNEDMNTQESYSKKEVCQKSTDESKEWKNSEKDLQTKDGKSSNTKVYVDENRPSVESVLVLSAASKETETTTKVAKADSITNLASNDNFISLDETANESDQASTNPTEEEDIIFDMSDAHELTSDRSDTNEFIGEHNKLLTVYSDNSSLHKNKKQPQDVPLITNSKITPEADNKVMESVNKNKDALSNQINHKNIIIPCNDTATTHFSKSIKQPLLETLKINKASLETRIQKKTLILTPTKSEQYNDKFIKLQHNVNKPTTSRPMNAISKWEKIKPTLSTKEEIQDLSPNKKIQDLSPKGEIQDLSPKEEIHVLKSICISTSVDDAQDICTAISDEVVSNPDSDTAPRKEAPKHYVKSSDISIMNVATSENTIPGLVDTKTSNDNAQKLVCNTIMEDTNPVDFRTNDNNTKEAGIVISDKKVQGPVCTTTSYTYIPKSCDNAIIEKDAQKTICVTTTDKDVQKDVEISILDTNTSTSVCIEKYKKDVITGTPKVSATLHDIGDLVPVCYKTTDNVVLKSVETSTCYNDISKRIYTATPDQEVNKIADLQENACETIDNEVSKTQCTVNCENAILKPSNIVTSKHKLMSILSATLNENIPELDCSSTSVNDLVKATSNNDVMSQRFVGNISCISDIQNQECAKSDTLMTSSKTENVLKHGQSDKEDAANNEKGDYDVVDLLAEQIPKPSPYENKRKIKLLANTCILSKSVKIIHSTKNRQRIKSKMSVAKRNIVTDDSDNFSVTIKNEEKEKNDVQQSKTDKEDDKDVKKKDCVVIDLTDEESPTKSNKNKRKLDLETGSDSKESKRGRIEQNNRKIKSKVTIAKQNEIANHTDDTGPKQMRNQKDPDKRRTTESKKNSKYESERNYYKRNVGKDRDYNYRTSIKRSDSKEYERKYESSKYDRNFLKKREYAYEHEIPSLLLMNTQPMSDVSYVGLKVDPSTAHARCFNEVVEYAYDFMRRYCDYNEISSQEVTPVRRFRTNLMRQLKATFDRYFYGPNNPYDPIYSLTGPQPRFRNEDIMIRTILHTIKKPHIRRGTDCHSCQFDDVIGYEGYKIPCFWCKVEFRQGEFLRALPILDRSYAY
ncbi:uncharacterized protein LOC127700987 isoform X1 [Mytilus californianus]|uniref:uncharacterized protein LOC127700987 isoform X1 n=1 Tax=Mytilus californianus TaxID=6549 RepID=UPI00224828EA|nr:uncharacterized protein LOC127700987 isoform X1 [Mytilus californianus]